jgi:hypothetical protein
MLKFVVYNPNEDFDEVLPESAMDIDTFLKQEPSWIPALEDIFLVFTSLTESLNSDLNPFGLLNFIIPQFNEISNRLKAGEFAVLRTAGDWTPSFFIFEPRKDITYLSLLGLLPFPLSTYYPCSQSPTFTKDNIDQRKELYSYIEKNRSHLKPDSSYSNNLKMIQNVPLPQKDLLTALTQQIVLGKELLNHIHRH